LCFCLGSGAAQVCNTGVAFTPGTGSIILLSTATANTGAGFTLNANSLGAKSVAKYSGGAKTTTLAANDILSGLNPMWYDGTNWVLYTPGTGGGASGVSSFSGDGTLLSNSSSTGAVTATLANAAAHKFFGNNTGSSAAPGYQTVGPADMTAQAADTVLMNATGGSAAPTATAMPTCTTGADLYNTTTHTWSCVSTGGGGSSDFVNITGSSQITATGCTQSASTGGVCTVSGTSTSTITLSVIPGTYNNLKLYLTTKTTGSNAGVILQFNSDTGSNYTVHGLNIASSTVTGVVTTSTTSAKMCSVPASTGIAASCMSVIPNYANTTFPKVILSNGSDIDSISSGTNDIYTSLGSGWNNTAAITSISIIGPANFGNGTIVSLYGEK
jgi:hypothetical protein